MLHCDPEVGWVSWWSIWSCCQFSDSCIWVMVMPRVCLVCSSLSAWQRFQNITLLAIWWFWLQACLASAKLPLFGSYSTVTYLHAHSCIPVSAQSFPQFVCFLSQNNNKLWLFLQSIIAYYEQTSNASDWQLYFSTEGLFFVNPL